MTFKNFDQSKLSSSFITFMHAGHEWMLTLMAAAEKQNRKIRNWTRSIWRLVHHYVYGGYLIWFVLLWLNYANCSPIAWKSTVCFDSSIMVFFVALLINRVFGLIFFRAPNLVWALRLCCFSSLSRLSSLLALSRTSKLFEWEGKLLLFWKQRHNASVTAVTFTRASTLKHTLITRLHGHCSAIPFWTTLTTTLYYNSCNSHSKFEHTIVYPYWNPRSLKEKDLLNKRRRRHR